MGGPGGMNEGGDIQSHKNPCSVAALQRENFGSLVDFCGNVHQNSRCFVAIFPPSVALLPWKISIKKYSVLLENFDKNCCHLVGNFHKKLPLWLISTKKCLYGKFSQKSCLYEKFPQNFISTTTGFVRKFSQKVTLLEHFHNTLFS